MKRHKADWGSLIAGLLFIGLGTALVVRGTGDWGFELVWVLPILAIGLGLAGIARALIKSRDSEARGRQ